MKHPTNWFKSLGYAFNGCRLAMQERNFRFHIIAAIAVCIIAYMLNLNSIEWAFLFSAIAMVIVVELFNTAIEYTCDLISTNYLPLIKRIKDISAAAVLLSAVYALLIACCILLPNILIHF